MTNQLIDGHGLGAIPSSDIRERRYAAAPVLPDVLVTLPARVSLAGYRTAIEDQGQEGSCVGHASSTAGEMLAKIMGLTTDIPLSRRDAYYWARKLANLNISQDTGAPLNTGCDSVLGGLCREQTWRYVAGQFAQLPPAGEGERTQFQYMARHESLFPNNPDHVLAIKSALANNQPVMIGLSVYGDFFLTPQRNGVMPVTTGGGYQGGHAMVLWGFQDDSNYPGGGYFCDQQSWGLWTQKPPDPEARAGDMLVPYAAVQSGIIFEARAFVARVAPPPPPNPPTPPDGNRISRLAAIDAVTAALRALPAV